MKKRDQILVGALLLTITLFGCSNDKNTQPVFGEKNKAYEGFTYLQSAVLEDSATNQDAVVYLLKSTDSYAIDNKGFASNNGIGMSMELNTISYDETKTIKENLAAVVEGKTKEIGESKSNTAYLLENKEVWSDETRAVTKVDYIWQNTISEEYTYKQHCYCLWNLGEEKHALMELTITAEEVADETLLSNVLKEIEAYYGVLFDYDVEAITAKEEAFKIELERIKKEEALAKLSHEQGDYTFCLPEGYKMQMSYDDLNMKMYGKNDTDYFMFFTLDVEVGDEQMAEFEQFDEDELNQMVKEELQLDPSIAGAEYHKLNHDVLGTVAKCEMEMKMKEGGESTFAKMFITVKDDKVIMAVAGSPDESAAAECAQMFIDTIQIKGEKEDAE